MKRIDFIDFLRGIAIISVVFLHCFNGYNIDEHSLYYIILYYITSFQMPLFFSISGYLFNYDKEIILKYELKKKIKALFLPYVLWGLCIGFLIENIRIIIRKKAFADNLVFNILTLQTSYLASWFLIVLLLVFIIELIIAKYIKNYKTIFIIHILIFLASFICNINIFRIKHVLISLIFFFFGNLIKKEENCINNKDKKYLLVKIILSFGLGSVIAFINSKVTYSSLELGNILLFYISALLTIYFLFNLIKSLKINYSNKIIICINLLGKDSIIVLLTHPILLYLIRVLEKIFSMEIHTFPVLISFSIILILEIIIVRKMPSKLKILFGK